MPFCLDHLDTCDHRPLGRWCCGSRCWRRAGMPVAGSSVSNRLLGSGRPLTVAGAGSFAFGDDGGSWAWEAAWIVPLPPWHRPATTAF